MFNWVKRWLEEAYNREAVILDIYLYSHFVLEEDF